SRKNCTSALRIDAAPCRPGIAFRSVRASCPDSRAKHPCFACRDPRPTGRGSTLLLLRCSGDQLVRSHAGDLAMVVPGRGLRKAADGCAAAASQPWVSKDVCARHCRASVRTPGALRRAGPRSGLNEPGATPGPERLPDAGLIAPTPADSPRMGEEPKKAAP